VLKGTLAGLAEHPGARERYLVVLAMEAGEAGHADKALKLIAEFSGRCVPGRCCAAGAAGARGPRTPSSGGRHAREGTEPGWARAARCLWAASVAVRARSPLQACRGRAAAQPRLPAGGC
jgi:hypothetical protein